MTDSITWTQLGSDITGDVLSDWASKSAIAVSESGNIIAIGSEKANANGIDSGQVSVYKYSIDTNSWIQLGKVINGETEGDFFGSSLLSLLSFDIAVSTTLIFQCINLNGSIPASTAN